MALFSVRIAIQCPLHSVTLTVIVERTEDEGDISAKRFSYLSLWQDYAN